MLLERERNYDLGMDALVTVCSWKHERNYDLGMGALVTVCSWKHERNYDLGMDALVTVCSENHNETMIWAWMLRSPYALGTRTKL